MSECADRHRILGQDSAFPGRWETRLYPFQRGIMDAFAEDCVEEIWVKKCTKVGLTDCSLNMILYAVLQDPGPALFVEPNEDLAEEISQTRINQMIRDCEELNAQCLETVKTKKQFRNMVVDFAWAGSPSSLAFKERRFIFFDEVNKYLAFTGKEADPVSLGKERATTFKLSRKFVLNSTPTEEEGYITVGEKNCDCCFRFLCPCPHCGHRQELVFSKDTVKFGEDHDPRKVEESAWYECQECHKEIYSDQKPAMVQAGEWYDSKSGLVYREALDKIRPKSVGFKVSRFLDPLHSFGDIAAEFLRSKDNYARLMNFYNSWLGEEFVQTVSHKEEHDILKHRAEIEPLALPPGTIALTAGADPGQHGFWFTVIAWYLSEPTNEAVRTHLVEYGFLPTWDTLREKFISSVYTDAAGERFPVWRSGVDTGGSEYGEDTQTMTEAAYNFLRQHGQGRIWGTKGDVIRGKRMKHFMRDKMPGKSNMLIPGGLLIWHMDTEQFRNDLHYRLSLEPGTAGGITLHSATGNDFVRHVLAHEKRKNRKGQTEWVQLHRADHLQDALLIALAMGDSECWGGVHLIPRKRAPQQVKAREEIEPKEVWVPRRESWLKR